MRPRLSLAASLIGTLACCTPPSDPLQLRIRSAVPLSVDAIRFRPADNVRAARLGPNGALSIERRDSRRPLAVEIPGACPVEFPAGPARAVAEARPVIDLGPERGPVGFDAPFEIVARHGCPERGRGAIAWQPIEGAATELATSDDGFRLRARTPRFEAVHPEPVPDGIVPISPRTQGRIVLEARWTGPGFEPIQKRLTIRATSRATGLSSVAVSQQLLLSGAGWRVKSAPQGGHARVHAAGPVSLFNPDVHGRWLLEDSTGQALGVQAFWHDKTPYDCGRSECHGAISRFTEPSPMSHALERQLGSTASAAVGCRAECHSLGEPGLRDGGFAHVAQELGWVWQDGTRWDDLPQSLRRLGGVRCTACHGPGAIPEPEGRALILRSDVCATCHDAPPNYQHVAQWRSSRMARSDATPSTREGVCARCHTTAGFLNDQGAGPPREIHPSGIACAACHAPHADASGPRLVRHVRAPATELLEPRTAVCVGCHSPILNEPQPSASSASLWLGRATVPAANGGGWEELTGDSPHRVVAGGCVGCHGGATELDHSFRVAADGCQTCHREPDPIGRWQALRAELEARIEALARALSRQCPGASLLPAPTPPHAAPTAPACASPQAERARYVLRFLREDGAAAVHNPTFARRLLDDVAAQLGASAR